MNLAIFASGNGSNFQAIIREYKRGRLKVKKIILVCDQPAAMVIRRALKNKIKAVLISRCDFKTRKDFERAIVGVLKDYSIDLLALAGFMRVLSPAFVKQYRNRIINIHPSLLPAYKGASAIKDVFESGCAYTGVTVHFVDEQVDHGPVILQQRVDIRKNETLPSLEKKIHFVEHKLYPQALRLLIDGKLRVRKGKVFFS